MLGVCSFLKAALRPRHEAEMVPPALGCVVTGVSGSGKSWAVSRAIEDTTIVAVSRAVSCPDLFRQDLGQSEAALRTVYGDVFRSLQALAENESRNRLGVIVLDHIDVIGTRATEVERRMLHTLIAMLDMCHSSYENDGPAIVTIGVTSRYSSLDECLFTHGRLARLIEVLVPSADERAVLLTTMLSRMPLTCSINDALSQIVPLTSAFVPSDLAQLCSDAALRAMTEAKSIPTPQSPVEPSQAGQAIVPQVSVEHLIAAAASRPSLLRDELAPQAEMQLEHIRGMDKIVAELKMAVLLPLVSAASFSAAAVNPPRGVLLYGPSGTGKTMLARSIAQAAPANYVEIQPVRILSRVVGESEQNLRRLMDKARNSAPCIVLIDNIHLLAPVRRSDGETSRAMDRLLSLLLTEMDGVMNDIRDKPPVIVIATTHDRALCDSAILRAGRFDRHLAVALPDTRVRYLISLEPFSSATTNQKEPPIPKCFLCAVNLVICTKQKLVFC
eukprot:c11239_g1_i2.p1 GENE.c11239_g1_i2~~c11239_g1_i2.p1  ORF type:complete len:501 (+),score=82.55 c11239_g1_i2:33-1535(+)